MTHFRFLHLKIDFHTVANTNISVVLFVTGINAKGKENDYKKFHQSILRSLFHFKYDVIRTVSTNLPIKYWFYYTVNGYRDLPKTYSIFMTVEIEEWFK